MRIVTIKQELYKMFSEDKELLNKSRRPCVVVLRLKYKGRRYNFAVPLRSNITAAAPKNQYFPLPPRPTTRPRNRHGIHYIKMFPIKKEYLLEYHTEGNASATLMKKIIDRNTKTIVTECQNYLDEYAKGNRPKYSSNIDYLIEKLFRE